MVKFIRQPSVTYVESLLNAFEKLCDGGDGSLRVIARLCTAGVIIEAVTVSRKCVLGVYGAVSVDYVFAIDGAHGARQETTTSKFEETAQIIYNFLTEEWKG